MTRGFAEVEALFSRAERSIALLDRCRPLNAAAEARRTLDLWRRGRPENPRFTYAPAPDLSWLRAELHRACRTLDTQGDPLDRLYLERALELETEARIAAAVGTPEAAPLARHRYPAPRAPLSRMARTWARQAPPRTEADRVPSDAALEPQSLLCQLTRAVARLDGSVSVVIARDLQSVAAVGWDTVFIKPNVWLTAAEARRIVVHELFGHVLPRQRSRSASLGLLRVGAANAADDEEGRALLLEQRHGLMGVQRQRELGQRHLAALSVIEGAEWVDTVRLLVDLGAELDGALVMANRVHRGGDLARESVYLSRLRSVEQALADRPELEDWFEAGRVSVKAARVLSACGYSPNFTKSGVWSEGFGRPRSCLSMPASEQRAASARLRKM